MRFLAPIGSDEERRSLIVPPGKWTDATGYATYYSLGYHTGNDWNLNYPHFDADAHSTVWAIGPGTVTYAQRWPNPGAWGNIIVIDHGLVDGLPCFSRYGHVETLRVSVGQVVNEWSHIADVGNGNGLFAYHLHFDISTTEQLKKYPGDWPGTRLDLVKLHYVDPVPWLRRDHTLDSDPLPEPEPIPEDAETLYVQVDRLNLRAEHSTTSTVLTSVARNAAVVVTEVYETPQYRWRWATVNGRTGWLCERENNTLYLMPAVRVRATETLNIRQSPTVNSALLGRVAKDTVFEVVGLAQNGYIKRIAGGWVLFSYLTEV